MKKTEALQAVGKEALVEGLKQYALQKLEILQGYSQAKAEFEAAARAYRSFTGLELDGAPSGPGRPKFANNAGTENKTGRKGKGLNQLSEHGVAWLQMIHDAGSGGIGQAQVFSTHPVKGMPIKTFYGRIQDWKRRGLIKPASFMGGVIITKEGSERLEAWRKALAAEKAEATPTKTSHKKAASTAATKTAPTKTAKRSSSNNPQSITSGDNLLKALAGHANPVRPIELAELIGATGPARDRVAVSLAYLRTRGLVGSEKNGTGSIYHITAAGKEHVAAGIQ